MNYRHAFHAGNFGDVLKHVVLVALIERLLLKESPLFFLDTHAGHARYDLESIEARRSREAEAGIRRVAAERGATALTRRYVQLVRAFDPENAASVRWYPGSPRIAAALLRPQDRAALCEIEPGEALELRREFAGDRRFGVHERDGYEALKGLLPPVEKRGLVLLDPPYEEQERELTKVADSLVATHARWPQGVLAAWYPIKHGVATQRFLERVRRAGLKRSLAVELCLHPADSRVGLNGSGMLCVNAPWQVDELLAGTMPALHRALSPDGHGSTSVDWIVPPTD
jgi:23S rRNA (adenine2030-N6)-methyltransferase